MAERFVYKIVDVVSLIKKKKKKKSINRRFVNFPYWYDLNVSDIRMT